ncbi:hypothetical protein SASPL_137108 [Salvia splendens]|uniref:BRI1 kinase inhibitor 1 n=1 Tax=Salvia splendens TaxID=180675 RepID=A0A8X8WSA9_SALSN|nr:BRI1 kinase inhibitor 1-like [Salvia splendens]KAG6400283.1 hypothetical protein SASPL_137108 [Salvia splendens]
MKAQHPNEAQPNVQPKKHHVPLNQTPPSPPHEFSFTISLHQPAAAKPSPPPFAAAIDLSPADDIFFHGHLLPLHLLHHLPVSPRSSTNSVDSFTLPIKELLNNNNNNNSGGESRHVVEGKERGKSKSFSLLGIRKKERKDDGDDVHISSDNRNKQQSTEKRKSRFELIKRYVRFVTAFLSPLRRRRRSSGEIIRQQPYSYSGNIRVRKRGSVMRGRRGEFSAPASMRTSPGNSGMLQVVSGATTPTAGKSDSTMEELQAAIQAAIAHCKKSNAVEDKSKRQP